MFTLYIANKNYSSWSLRPWVLMRALAIPFDEVLEPFLEGSCWDKFRDFSPNGRVPCLHDGEIVVWDSLAIIEYLATRYAQRLLDLDAMRAWYAAARQETWRDQAHEQELLDAGVVIKDLRTPLC